MKVRSMVTLISSILTRPPGGLEILSDFFMEWYLVTVLKGEAKNNAHQILSVNKILGMSLLKLSLVIGIILLCIHTGTRLVKYSYQQHLWLLFHPKCFSSVIMSHPFWIACMVKRKAVLAISQCFPSYFSLPVICTLIGQFFYSLISLTFLL